MDLAVRYGPEIDQVADVVFPDGAGRAPLVLLLHGGYWRVDVDRGYLGPTARALARHGFVVANVEYRRVGGGGGWPATFTDVGLALDTLPWLIEDARPGRVDPAKVVVLGHSAGGTLALGAAAREELAGVVAIAPVSALAEAHRGDPTGSVEQLLGGGPDEVPERYTEADPMAQGPAGVPVVVLHGDRDTAVPLEMSRTYAAASGAELVVVPAGHFDALDPGGPAWTSVVDTLAVLSTVEGV